MRTAASPVVLSLRRMIQFRRRIPGFTAVQRAIDRAILDQSASTPAETAEVKTQLLTMVAGLNLHSGAVRKDGWAGVAVKLVPTAC